jgi:hypothetical protein
MTDKEKAVIIIDLIEKVTQEIIDKPLQRKKYLQMRGHLEKAVKLTGNGIKREWSRPPSLPIFQHEKGTAKPFNPRQAATYWLTIHPNQHAKERKSNGNI